MKLDEIERQRARDSVRIWIKQKLNCLNDKYRCGRDERRMIFRITKFDQKICKSRTLKANHKIPKTSEKAEKQREMEITRQLVRFKFETIY